MRLLVTGGSGFLGGHVLAEAARRGHCCVALARSPEAARAVAARGATPLRGDLDQDTALARVFDSAGCDALVNLASLGFGRAPGIVGAALRAGLDRAVFVSTTAVTTTLPARSKALRLAARGSALSWTILRPTMINGAAGDRNLSRLLVLLARPRRARVPLVAPVPGGGRQLQQPVHVADLAGAVLTAVERREAAGRGYDVAGPEPLTFADVLRGSAAAVGGRVHLASVPLAPVIALTRGYERASRGPGPCPRISAPCTFYTSYTSCTSCTSCAGIPNAVIATLTRRSHAQYRQEPPSSRPWPAGAVARPGQVAV
jgi:uncharacterized protein YbjT (DUF2867 family)